MTLSLLEKKKDSTVQRFRTVILRYWCMVNPQYELSIYLWGIIIHTIKQNMKIELRKCKADIFIKAANRPYTWKQFFKLQGLRKALMQSWACMEYFYIEVWASRCLSLALKSSAKFWGCLHTKRWKAKKASKSLSIDQSWVMWAAHKRARDKDEDWPKRDACSRRFLWRSWSQYIPA